MQYEGRLVHGTPELQCCMGPSFPAPALEIPSLFPSESIWELFVLTHYPGTLLQCAKGAEQGREAPLSNI